MSTKLVFGPFVLDTERSTLTREGRPAAISSRGFDLLKALVAAPGRVVTKRDLMQAAWADTAIEESNLSVQIAALRKQLGPAPDGGEWIATAPRAGYRFVGEIAAQPATDQPLITPGDRPSIAVLPFTNVSGEKEQEYLADGITEDIITALTRFRWFFVIARNSSFVYKGKSLEVKQIAQELGVRYLLGGSVRKAGGRVRISAQLIDARSGNHIWAERYDLELTEVFAIQDEIAERVAGAIEPELLKSQGAEAVASHRQHDCLGPGAARHLAFSSRRPRTSPEGARVVPGCLQARSRAPGSSYLACARESGHGCLRLVGGAGSRSAGGTGSCV
jgi:TolB-like protein